MHSVNSLAPPIGTFMMLSTPNHHSNVNLAAHLPLTGEIFSPIRPVKDEPRSQSSSNRDGLLIADPMSQSTSARGGSELGFGAFLKQTLLNTFNKDQLTK